MLPRALIALNGGLGSPRWQNPLADGLGAVLVCAGIAAILYCSQLFRQVGRGTPVPSEPPITLVVSGLYRFSRNLIYVADLGIPIGIFLVEGHITLLVYAGTAFIALQADIVWWEEPGLRARFGSEYEDYLLRVPRWLGPRAN